MLNWLQNALPGPRPITRKALTRIDHPTLLRRSRDMAHAVYVGDRTVLCRVLGRYRLYVASDDVGFGVHVILDGVWEGWLTLFMARLIKPGMTIVDVGANHGYYTLLFAHLAGPKGRVAAIEPHPRTADLLTRSIYANGFQPWTTVFQCAATARDDTVLQLQMPPHEPKNAHLVAQADPADAATVAVKGSRLDTLLADWPRIDFMKVDVEGAEEACLEGAWPLIERDRPILVLEFNPERCADPVGLLDRLERVYGRIRTVDRQSRAVMTDRAALLDQTRGEDWMLYLA